MRYHEFRAMSTEILLAAEGPADRVEEGFQRTQAFIEASEKRFTRFSEDSELSSLNRSAGTWFEASPEMYQLISLAVRLHQQTQGLFDPGILSALEQAGYDRTIDEVRSGSRNGSRSGAQSGSRSGARPVAGPTSATVLEALMGGRKPSLFSKTQLDPGGRRIWLPEGLRIDLGGIAKGWIAEQAANLLANWCTSCAVDAGGDAYLIGHTEGEGAWRLTLEDPCDAGRALAVLKLPPGAVATSAITKRRWQKGGKTQHHLIDPRTQQPAETDWLSVTAVARHAADAEVYAKCLLIVGSAESNRVARLGSGIEFIAVDENKKLWGSSHSREFIDG